MMTEKVRSFVAGEWITPTAEGTVISDAATGKKLASVSSEGVDQGRTVAYGRTIGGPALRRLTFHQRAEVLKKLAAYLTEHAAELTAPYPTTGNTSTDAMNDVFGGIRVLEYYAKLAQRELPNDTIIIDGPTREVSKKSFIAQDIYTSRHGVALFINAFNFPVWGLLEKFAPAFLAGTPTITKPATPTAHIAVVLARLMVESELLPEGSFQFLAGSLNSTGPASDGPSLMDQLGGQDSIAFTGSASTASLLRATDAVVKRGARFNAEADSLNAALLGPDISVESDEFAFYIKTLLRELTSKAGQKCTAIRRAIVPADRVDDVVEALRAKLSSVVIGNPHHESTTMGPLVSAGQRQSVAEAVKELAAQADVIIGGADMIPQLASAEPADCYFMPTVLVARDARARAVHSVEAFGPVTTVIGYQDLEDAVELVRLGDGSLVASLVTDDPDVVATVVRGIAPFHGRLMITNAAGAKSAPQHGAALPQLIHGGPGRAGGGEELGGVRAIRHYMQASSIATPADMMVPLTRRWNSGATAVTTSRHPFRLFLDELELGDTLFTDSRLITLSDVTHFAEFTGDKFYAHMDEEAAKASPLFTGRVAHGYFVIAAAAGLFVDPDPGPVLANYGLENLRFQQPVYPGDSIKLRLTCKSKTLRSGAPWGEVVWDVEVTNDKDEVVATYDLLTINAAKPS